MLKSVVIDDEKNGRELLMHMLGQYCENIEVCGSANNVRSAVELINTEEPDVVFLDIEMSDGSGFDVLEKTIYNDFAVIFVTGYDQYAIRAIKCAAMDYLLKPIDLEELKKAAQSAFTLRNNWEDDQLKETQAANEKETLNEIIIHGKFKKSIVQPNEIIYFESDGNYTQIHLLSNKCITASKNLNYFESLLQDLNFYRLHRGFIANLTKIKRVHTGRTSSVEMENGMILPLAVRRKTGFLKKFKA